MRNWANRLCGLVVALACGAQAQATPPEIFQVTDRLFARSADRIYLLRQIATNNGLHTVWQTDTLLIHRTLDRGDDRGFQVVARTVDYGPDADPRAEPVPHRPLANPFDLFLDPGVWPLDPPIAPFPDRARLDTEGLTVHTRTHRGETWFNLPLPEVEARIEDTLAASRGIIPFERVVGGGSTGPDPFDPGLYDILRDCTVWATQTLLDTPTDPTLAKLRCADPDELQVAILWLVVPMVVD